MELSIGRVDPLEQPSTMSARQIEAQRVSKQFEAVMLSQSFAGMFEGVGNLSMGGGGHAEKVWQSILVDEMAKSVAEAGGVGIADRVYKELMEK